MACQQHARRSSIEDAEVPQAKQGRLTRLRLFKVDRYSQVYQNVRQLDANAQNEAARRAGIETPSAPPAE